MTVTVIANIRGFPGKLKQVGASAQTGRPPPRASRLNRPRPSLNGLHLAIADTSFPFSSSFAHHRNPPFRGKDADLHRRREQPVNWTLEKAMMLQEIPGVRIPDSKLAREMTQFIRETESDLLFHHSVRVYCWGVLAGNRMGLKFDPELLYAASMFHDIGLTARYEGSQLRFEVDGANAARDFLQGHGISANDIETVWNAVALHTTPGIPQFMRPEIALLQAGAGMDVAGRGYDQFTDSQREAVVAAFPRESDFKHGIIDAFYQGMKHRPDSTFGTFNDDVLAFKDPHFRRKDMCTIILASSWNGRTGCDVPKACSSAHDHHAIATQGRTPDEHS